MSVRLALGTVQFGQGYGVSNQTGRVKIDEVAKILTEASSQGIDLLDTAIGYGDSEHVLGQIGVANWKVVTKLPSLPDECMDVAGWVEAEVKGSLARLGVDSLYVLMLHRPDQLFEMRGKHLLDALQNQKEQGLAKKIGVSIYTPNELAPLFDRMQFDLVQAPLSVLDQRLVESGWTQYLKRHAVELHVRSVFLQGLLLMPTERRPTKFLRWQTLWLEWERWLDETSLTPLEACLRYAFSVCEVDKVVVGVESAIQLREILAAAEGSLSSVPNWPKPIDVDLLDPSKWNYL